MDSPEALFDRAPCGYVVLNSRGVMAKVNQTLAEWVGEKKEELIGKRMTILLTVAGNVFYETNFEPTLRLQGFCEEIAFDLKTKGGKRLPVTVSARGRLGGDDTGVTLVTVFRSVKRRQLERDLLQARQAAENAKEELADMNASLRTNIRRAVGKKREAQRILLAEKETGELREQFVAVLGHDLRNPLASISAAGRVLAPEVTSERGKQVLQLMAGSVSRMSGLIDNVLDFARGRLGGGIQLTREPNAPLSPVIEQVIEELRASAPGREILSKLLIPRPVNADHARLGQLVSNLLGNAISHGDASHPIYVDATLSEDGTFTLSVTNNGKEIPKDRMERLFEPFVRGDTKNDKGLGLGLHIASQIAKAHGGTLVATSSNGETRFTFVMPPSAAGDDAGRSSSPSPAASA